MDRAEKEQKLRELNEQVKAQWKKYEEAVGRVPHVALVQIDQKLGRLERERDDLSSQLRR